MTNKTAHQEGLEILVAIALVFGLILAAPVLIPVWLLGALKIKLFGVSKGLSMSLYQFMHALGDIIEDWEDGGVDEAACLDQIIALYERYQEGAEPDDLSQ